ncbi:uncharacterized protein LOC120317791 isoform X2 [Crotalus tigris]|uniref:uncharacterized protein LOC120317791 isoform X2 n=1 Tax=Crotalus tigris TaxID=88082 RepID=UPI00192F5C02|nr:uncharacterized protein LOC120317791 isoform X2 [Crotalus tigris]
MPGHCHCLAHHSFSHPPPLHLSFLRCLQITCLCKECLCLYKDWPMGASPAHLPSRLPPPWPGLLSSLAFRHGHRTLLGAAPPTSLLADLHSQATLRLDLSSRPTKEDPLSLRERPGWFSGASKSNVGSLEDPHRSAPQECCWMSSQLLPGYCGTRAPG